ncbi:MULTISPECIES: IclR family transcriptional regulator [unclassified Fusibacter]|uniref:IclR family transcriptional regulator n=1 Tax=unclassified Fusibacter TaxID=2624464 RepID=UPI0010111339|nr:MULTISPECIES: IclR family transcriptional regulator [unclassified Fusibacter]MCK8058435.1 IclR family transcriptional regulator [Fusibacter sp. A2]NPE22797.1 IclR family transcriptional regulator [Fusibacter sp. A1]RXV60353.1 IclR family transcriptional regulator [Fusibacter sp. A1]
MGSNGVKKNQSVGKLIDIIEVMATYGESIRINELAEILDMATATVYRFLITLVDRGYVKKDEENSKYFLTLKLKYFADQINDNTNLSHIVQPYLKQLAEMTGETTSLVIMEDNMAVYINKYDGPKRMVGSLQRIGKRAPLYCTGVGKLFLADMTSDERFEALEKSRPFEKLTQNTIVETELIRLELEKVKFEQISYDNEECEVGAKCIAAAIRDYSGKVVAAISISGPTTRMTSDKLKVFKTELTSVCIEISSILGYIEKV